MIKAIIIDLSRVLVFPRQKNYRGRLTTLYNKFLHDPDKPFKKYLIFNTELCDYIQVKKLNRIYDIFIFGASPVLDAVECRTFLYDIVKGIYSSDRMGVKKYEPSAYRVLCSKLKLTPSEVLFIDNVRRNTDAAERAGLNTITYRNNIQLKTEMTAFLNLI